MKVEEINTQIKNMGEQKSVYVHVKCWEREWKALSAQKLLITKCINVLLAIYQ